MQPLDGKFVAGQVARLYLLRGFPQKPEAIASLIGLLRNWCQGARIAGCDVIPETQCIAVVNEALVRMDGWTSPRALKEIFDELYNGLPVWGPNGRIE